MAQFWASWRNEEFNIWNILGIGAILGNGVIWMAQFGTSWRIEWRNLGVKMNICRNGAMAQLGISWRNSGHHGELNDAIWGIMAQFGASWRNWDVMAQFGTSWRIEWRNLGVKMSICRNGAIWRKGAIWDIMAQFWASWRIKWRNLGHYGAILGIMAQLGCHGAIWDIMTNQMTQFGASWRNLRHHGVIGWLAQFGTSWRKMNVQNRLNGLRHFLMAHFSHHNSPEFMVEIGYRDLYGYSTPRYPRYPRYPRVSYSIIGIPVQFWL